MRYAGFHFFSHKNWSPADENDGGGVANKDFFVGLLSSILACTATNLANDAMILSSLTIALAVSETAVAIVDT